MRVFNVFFLLYPIMISSVELVTYATDPDNQNLALLERTRARWNGWSALNVIGTQAGFDTHGLVDKLRALRRFAKGQPGETILVFVDAYDVVINNEPFGLEAAFLASGKRVLVASELGCCVDKRTALAYRSDCHKDWPFEEKGGRRWLNSGVIVGYARDIRRLLRLAWREYLEHQDVYKAYTDQQLLCFLMSDGATIWTRKSVGIDHQSDIALTTYRMDISVEGAGQLSLDDKGRIVFENRTIPAIIHFNGPKNEKEGQMNYARLHFPLVAEEGRGAPGGPGGRGGS